MSDYKIYVDAGRPATLNDGAGALTDCTTLQEAVLAWQRLPPEQKIRATVKVIGGPVYTTKEPIPELDGSGSDLFTMIQRRLLTQQNPVSGHHCGPQFAVGWTWEGMPWTTTRTRAF